MGSKKEKRRSSFVHGRKSRTFAEDTLVVVPSGFSDNERLLFCNVEKSLRHLQASSPDLEELQQFTVHARECVTSEMFAHRTSHEVPCIRENPAIDAQLKQLPFYIEKLKCEQQAWTDLVQSHTHASDTLQAVVESMSEEDVVECPSSACLPGKESDFLDQKPNCTQVIDRTTQSYRDSKILNNKHLSKSLLHLEEQQGLKNARLMQASSELYYASFPDHDKTMDLLLQFCAND